jgi:hypothetical protein
MLAVMSGAHPTLAALAIAIAAVAQPGCGSDNQPATEASTSDSALRGRIHSSISDGAQLTGPIRWRAWVAQADVVSVHFLIDGEVAHVDTEAPYQFAKRAPAAGSHTFAVTAEVADGPRLTTASTATVAPGTSTR